MSRVIGIDLGTTYSCAAVVDRGEARIIRSRLGYTTVPSIVTFDEHGEPLVGQAAERRMILQPADTVYGSKRLLGRTFLPWLCERFQPHFDYRLAADEQGFVAAKVCGRIVPLVEVAALILHEMRRAAEQSLGERVTRAVVTVPAYFNENQRRLVREAGVKAKLDILRIINEPTAAALAFGVHRAEKKRILVFDLGGGTFDVSILELDGNVFNVLGTDGDTFLGGLDFDRRLMSSLIARIAEKLGRPLELDLSSKQRLRVAAQEAKHQLSVQERILVNLSQVTFTDGTRLDITGAVTRGAFEEMTADLLDQTIAVVQRALEAVRLKTGDIDEILLVGGQTRMPAVYRRLKALFGKEPTKRIHPEEAVALGAAIAADSHDRFDSAVLMDVLPLPIGIAAPSGEMRQVVGKNTAVPHQASVTIDIAPRAATWKVPVFQGSRPRATDNEYLGALVIQGIPPREKGYRADLVFALDSECLLRVRAVVQEAGINREVTLATQQTPDQVLAEMGFERVRTPLTAAPRPAPSASSAPSVRAPSVPAASARAPSVPAASARAPSVALEAAKAPRSLLGRLVGK